MKCLIDKRYLLVPMDPYAVKKELIFLDDGKPVRVLNVRLARRAAYYMPYDMREFIGRELDIVTEPETDIVPVLSDEPAFRRLYAEKHRPAAHFSAKRGWINDPNGLVYHDGRYHMFFQHDPVDSIWGNMHWGHAVSEDLVHWTELEEALFPDENGAMYSGSALVDSDNISGLGENGRAPLLLYYTAAGGSYRLSDKDSTQRLAYSTDGGNTFKKYPKAMIETVTPHNRDPKIIYCEEKSCWIMPIYLEGSDFALFRSDDLLSWTEFQRITLADDNECPDIYPLECGSERYWVMTAAHDRYLVGRFENGLFVPVQEALSLHAGNMSYAAQTFSNVPGGRIIRFGWNRSLCPGMPFTGSMTTPHDMTLERIDGKLRLCAYPGPEFDALACDTACGRDEMPLTGDANDICISIDAASGACDISLLGLCMTIDGDMLSVSGRDIKTRLYPHGGRYLLRIIQDKHSTEIYAGHGESTICIEHIPDYLLDRIVCKGADIIVSALKDIHM